MKVIGIDVSAHRVDVVLLEKFPTTPLRAFYLSPEFKQVHAVYRTNDIQVLVDRVLALAGESAAVAILEGKGTYSGFRCYEVQSIIIKYHCVIQANESILPRSIEQK